MFNITAQFENHVFRIIMVVSGIKRFDCLLFSSLQVDGVFNLRPAGRQAIRGIIIIPLDPPPPYIPFINQYSRTSYSLCVLSKDVIMPFI